LELSLGVKFTINHTALNQLIIDDIWKHFSISTNKVLFVKIRKGTN